MIVQGILDILSQWIAGIVGLIPALPVDVLNALSNFTSFVSQLAASLGVYSPIMPWDALGIAINVWLGVLSIWGVFMGVRLVLWILNR